MRRPTQVALIGALVCAALGGCTHDEPQPVDTTSSWYMYDNIFNPCRQMPQQFLSHHHLDTKPEGTENRIEHYVSLGCSYDNVEYDFIVEVSNASLDEIPLLDRDSFRETRIAGRAAKILSLPLEQRFCVLNIEMTGGILSLYLSRNVVLDPCATLTALAEELVPLLPKGV
ncbi:MULTISPECIES: DUF3558 family protein [Nocardia]|uniref:DUF3558 family protein n=1 Tax=Nocardia TaxID=1817 RepID=UPI002455D892|nr:MULTISPECIES: DUF3558 family protein [Nocardia]